MESSKCRIPSSQPFKPIPIFPFWHHFSTIKVGLWNKKIPSFGTNN